MEAAMAEIQVLFHGLATTAMGPPDAAKALPTAGPDLKRDAGFLGVCSLALFLFSWGGQALILSPMIRLMFKMSPASLKRCSQSVMEVIFYSAFVALGLMVVPMQPWVWPSENWWIGFGGGGHEVMRSDLRFYYLAYLARYIHMSASAMLEPKRKDFGAMVIHHLVTVIVIGVSYSVGWNRVGCVTMLLLDPADVPLHVAKVCKFIAGAKKQGFWQSLADLFFWCFVLTFFVTRLLMYGYVVWSMKVEAERHVPNCGGLAGATCQGIAVTLLLLQFYWFYLIMKVAVNTFRGGSIKDARSDDEDDEDEALAEQKAGKRRKGSSGPGGFPYVAAIGVLTLVIAIIASRNVEKGQKDLVVLLQGLWTVLSGDEAGVKTLPHSAPDIPSDTFVFFALAVVLFVFNWGLRLVFVEPLARASLGLGGATLAKFAQSVMEAVFYGGFAVIGLMVVPSQEWVWPSSQWWQGFQEGGHEIMRADLRCYYIMYIARYFQAIIAVLIEPKRKDIIEMLVHHVVTVVVIYISYIYGWNRVGVVVMVLLDPADVPLHLAKLCKYTAEASGHQVWQFVADRLFEVFALVFFVTRLILYSYVCWSAHIEATRYFPKGVPEWTCVVLLYTLLLLQVYWFFLIIRVAVKLLRGQGVEDPRSDDEDGEEETKSKKDR